MPIAPKVLRIPLTLAWITTAGCSSPDERLADMARESAALQRQQNETLAQQSGAVIRESHELAVAAKELVTKDAQARQDLLQAQRQLHGQLHEERTGVDRQRDALEAERRAIAVQRERDPIIGAAIQGSAALLACLAPLLLAAYALRELGRARPDLVELEEWLLCQVVPVHRSLLPRSGPESLPLQDESDRPSMGTR